MDGIAKFKGEVFKQSTAKNLNIYITFLNINCKIPIHIYADKVSKTLKWRDLTGPEK